MIYKAVIYYYIFDRCVVKYLFNFFKDIDGLSISYTFWNRVPYFGWLIDERVLAFTFGEEWSIEIRRIIKSHAIEIVCYILSLFVT